MLSICQLLIARECRLVSFQFVSVLRFPRLRARSSTDLRSFVLCCFARSAAVRHFLVFQLDIDIEFAGQLPNRELGARAHGVYPVEIQDGCSLRPGYDLHRSH